jgi:redox-regulated HSP33 family molecular chaperone
VESTLYALGETDIREMIEKGLDTPISCNFCSKVYTFSPEDLKKILSGITRKKKGVSRDNGN